MTRFHATAVACFVAMAAPGSLAAQDLTVTLLQNPVAIGSLSDVVFANAPFSADAVTTVTQTLADGTKIEQRTTAKWYRDASGRVRREQTVIGLDRLSPTGTPQTNITFDSVPGDPAPYTLDPANRTARRGPRGVQWLALGSGSYVISNGGGVYRMQGGDANIDLNSVFIRSARPYERSIVRAGVQTAPVPSDLKPTEEQLGTRQVEGVKATGRRWTTTIPAGRIGNDRAIQIVEEQWDAPELNMVVLSRFSDPRTGVVEYRLTNINRSEPRADLFTVPPDYKVVDAAPSRDALTPRPARAPIPPGTLPRPAPLVPQGN